MIVWRAMSKKWNIGIMEYESLEYWKTGTLE